MYIYTFITVYEFVMNSKANTAFVLLCCVLLLSHPVGFVAPASAASTAPEHHVDFCAIDFEPVENDLETTAEEVLDILPRWYQDVARGNSIILHVYDDRYPDDPYPKMSFVTYVGEDFQVRTAFGGYNGGFGGLELMLTVDTDCQTLNRIISSGYKADTPRLDLGEEADTPFYNPRAIAD